MILAQVPLFDAYEAHVINVTARIEPICEEGYKITGHKFNDLNQNGIFDSGEPGLAGWVISLQEGPYQAEIDYDDSGYTDIADYVILGDVVTNAISCPLGKDCDLDDDTDTDTDDLDILFDYITSHDLGSQLTAADGSYIFTYGVRPGEYIVREAGESGWTATTPAIQYVSVSDCEAIVDFGNFRGGSECPALSIGYWQNHEGCPVSSDWTLEINDFSGNYLSGYFSGISGELICEKLAPSNCPAGGSLAGRLCRAEGKTLADISNLVAGNLDPSAVIAGADDGSLAFDNLGLTGNSTILEALQAMEAILADENHTSGQLSDVNHVGERIYTFYEDENPSYPACLFSWEEAEPLFSPLTTFENEPNNDKPKNQNGPLEEGLILGDLFEEPTTTQTTTEELLFDGLADATTTPSTTEEFIINQPTETIASTTEPIVSPGCIDQTATNFNPEANQDDGSCQYSETTTEPTASSSEPTIILGCRDQVALNYNLQATQDDGSCTYPEPAIILGCLDQTAINYNPEATGDDDSCQYAPVEPEPETVPEEPLPTE